MKKDKPNFSKATHAYVKFDDIYFTDSVAPVELHSYMNDLRFRSERKMDLGGPGIRAVYASPREAELFYTYCKCEIYLIDSDSHSGPWDSAHRGDKETPVVLL